MVTRCAASLYLVHTDEHWRSRKGDDCPKLSAIQWIHKGGAINGGNDLSVESCQTGHDHTAEAPITSYSKVIPNVNNRRA